MPKPFTIIVAATPHLGIGHAGGLPWPMLRKEMAYFARVTKRVPSEYTSTNTSSANTARPPPRNAVIMGRKTWDSIPPKFRPLKDRINVVVTGSPGWFLETGGIPEAAKGEDVFIAGNVGGALSLLDEREDVARVFVIGGARVYAEAVQNVRLERLLVTRIEKNYECDVFFPVDVFGGKDREWARYALEELVEWTGETGLLDSDGREQEGEVGFEFCMFQRT